ncbi:unnamed protein product [Toxocara canis]|uniref:Cytochrome C biogenesis protein n=1 Tax=Toxocara canis TaxID=6265 RepID=A0A183VE23_TOXCA|nr:unnamed protein product [Toxocara canis]
MGAALLLLLAIVVGTGVAYHLGYLDPYIAQAQEQLKAKQTMGAALLLLLAIVVGTGVAYHLGYLDPYIAQAQEQLKAKQQ